MTLTLADFQRVESKIDRNGPIPAAPLRPVEGRCWLFRSWHNSAGYPYISVGGRDRPAHRVVFEVFGGENLDGLDLDHVCRNVACVNPAHHEAVTHAENIRRMGQAQTKCRKAGHDWSDPDNVYTRPNGRRFCRECARIDRRERTERARRAREEA